MALKVAPLHTPIVRWSGSRSRRSSSVLGSGESIKRRASITFALASSRVRPWLKTPAISGIEATTQPSSPASKTIVRSSCSDTDDRILVARPRKAAAVWLSDLRGTVGGRRTRVEDLGNVAPDAPDYESGRSRNVGMFTRVRKGARTVRVPAAWHARADQRVWLSFGLTKRPPFGVASVSSSAPSIHASSSRRRKRHRRVPATRRCGIRLVRGELPDASRWIRSRSATSSTG